MSVLGLTLGRERDDKTPNTTDIRISQLTDLCPFEDAETVGKMEKSELRVRRIFKKEQKGKVMLHKFLVWKTNKESTGRYPAYILYHTDYSSSRKDLLKRDMLYSNSEEQILQLLDAEIVGNIKKGWEEITK